MENNIGIKPKMPRLKSDLAKYARKLLKEKTEPIVMDSKFIGPLKPEQLRFKKLSKKTLSRPEKKIVASKFVGPLMPEQSRFITKPERRKIAIKAKAQAKKDAILAIPEKKNVASTFIGPLMPEQSRYRTKTQIKKDAARELKIKKEEKRMQIKQLLEEIKKLRAELKAMK